MNQFHNNLFYI